MTPAHAVVSALAAAAPLAAEPPAASILAADPANARILEYVKDRAGVHVRTFAAGAPMVEPVALAHARFFEGDVLVADRAQDAVWRLDDLTGEFLGALVAPRAGGLVAPAALWVEWSEVRVLSGADGSIRRYGRGSGEFLGVLVEPRGRASSMATVYSYTPRPRPLVVIAYPDAGEIRAFDAESGAFEAVIASGLERLVTFGGDWNGTIVVEDRALLPARVLRVYPPPYPIQEIAELPAGFLPVGLWHTRLGGIYASTASGLAKFGDSFEHAPSFWPAPPGASASGLLGHTRECYAECDTSTGPTILDIFDFLTFANHWYDGHSYACNCDTSTGPGLCDIFDFLCYLDFYAFGCP